MVGFGGARQTIVAARCNSLALFAPYVTIMCSARRRWDSMSSDALVDKIKRDIQWYEDSIPIRGCHLTLSKIKSAYRELDAIVKKEGERTTSLLAKPDDMSSEAFIEQISDLKVKAFLITVSIVGFDGETAYGDSEEIFDSRNLPFPIKTIYFTNSNSFKRFANGNEPTNRFSVWIHFDKPPLFDPNPLVSDPTPNYSKADIHSEDVIYFRAIQNIIGNKLKSDKKIYSFIHEKFAYDTGLWLFALPYALYWTTVYVDYFFPTSGRYVSFRVAGYIYGLGISLLVYRALSGYVKWAFPVNILEENNDNANRHRIVLGAIVLALAVSGVKSILSILTNIY